MKCEEVMKGDVECVSPRDTVENAAARMRDENVGFLPVCDESGTVLGTITDRDIAIRVVAGKRPGSSLVEAAMTRDVVACRPGDDLEHCEELMAEHHVSRVICVDAAGRLVGVISLSDIAQIDEDGHASDTLRQVSEREARI
jgi:CBS domain-containing protein